MEQIMFRHQMEIIDEVVRQLSDDIVSDLRRIGIGKISSDLRECAFSNYKNMETVCYGNRVPPLLTETFKNQDEFVAMFKSIKSKLCNIFELKGWQVRLCDFAGIGEEAAMVMGYYDTGMDYDKLLSIVLPNRDANIRIINDYMRRSGYLFTRAAYRALDDSDPESDFADVVCILFYAPQKMRDRSKEVRAMGDLKHITSAENINSIMKNGFVPKPRNGEGNIYYPPRVYFFNGLADDDYVCEYAGILSEEHKTEKIIVFKVSADKLPVSVKIYFDPLIPDMRAVFVEELIPSDAIIGWEELDK